MSGSVDLVPFNSIIARLEAVTAKLETGVGGGQPAGGGISSASAAGAVGDSKLMASLDAYLQKVLPPMDAAAKDSGVPDLVGANETVAKAFKMVRDGFVASLSAAKPKDQDWSGIMKPVMTAASEADKFCDNRSEYFQSRKAAKESLNIVMCLAQGAPGGYVQDMFETVDFHITKALQKKNAPEVAWVKALKEALKGFAAWCKEEVKMGLTWKHGGQDAAAYFSANPLGAGAGGASAAGGTSAASGASAAAAPKAGMAAMFGQLKGDVTSGLKKVSDDMKAKNRKDEAVLEPKAQVPTPAPKAAAGGRDRKGPRGDPILELQRDTHWVVENQDGQKMLVLEEASLTHLVCIINCRNTTVHIKNKVKGIAVDGCEKVNVICGDVISTVEFVNSDRIAFQTTGTVNAIAIDKVNGCNIHLPKESVAAEITSAKSCEMNVTIPDPKSSDPLDTIELPIPEQFVTKIQASAGKLNTEISSLYTH